VIYGRIEICRPCTDGIRMIWRIKLLLPGNTRSDAFVEGDWEYASRASALAAARRWAKRLGIEVVE
jgi:hypothetical protein